MVFDYSLQREIFGLKCEELRGNWRQLHNEEHLARLVRGERTEDCVEET